MENKKILSIALLALIFSFASFSGIGTTISSNIYNYYNGTNGTNGTSYNSTEFNNSMNIKVNKTGDDISGVFYNGTQIQLTAIDIRKDRFYLYEVNNSILRNYYQMNPYGHFFYGNFNVSGNFSAHGVLINSTETNISGNLKLMSLSPLSLVCSDSQRILGSCGISESDPIAMSQGFVTNSTMAPDNTKVNKSDDIMNRSSIIGEMMYLDKGNSSNILGAYSPWFQSTLQRTFYFRTTDRVWNYTSLIFDNLSHPEHPGSYDSLGNGNFQVGSFERNSTTKHLDFQVSGNSSYGTPFMVTIYSPNNFTVQTLAGSGNAYVCVDSTGKLYRGNPTC